MANYSSLNWDYERNCEHFNSCSGNGKFVCVGCNIWNLNHNIESLKKWCSDMGKDFEKVKKELNEHIKR